MEPFCCSADEMDCTSVCWETPWACAIWVRIVRGSGEVIAEDGTQTPFGPHTFMFIPKGVWHQHVNTGREPLWLVFVYGPHGALPTN